MSDIEITAIVIIVGNVLALVRVWLREHGRVKIEQHRNTVRRDIARSLPPGSRINDGTESVTIEVGFPMKQTDRRDAQCG
ncbi:MULTISPECIES: hypothetical protein [unclassified Streptomyces]|uniref:hypothetical protein n=1 Tax=unclassified Streptomyces TaxID=2593676 RepID=UPI00081B71A1|nr:MULTISPECIES: hypothetical protein [unclassified Streptomyces]MYY17412.1 hypothetical protein [Streptomyces sp. SID4912]SCE34337.1 hypothetical protein GA0115241_1133230 [Streptomyces sp. DpondAA-D4]